jgi:hypothetical protein
MFNPKVFYIFLNGHTKPRMRVAAYSVGEATRMGRKTLKTQNIRVEGAPEKTPAPRQRGILHMLYAGR